MGKLAKDLGTLEQTTGGLYANRLESIKKKMLTTYEMCVRSLRTL